jgi:hypothetical protein
VKVGEVLARYKPAERSVRILLDGSIQAEIDDARAELVRVRRAEARDDPGFRTKVPDLEASLAKLEQRADEAAVVFKVAAIPGREFDRLKYENPPSDADWQRYRETQQANPGLALVGRIGAPEFNFDAFMGKLIGLSVSSVDGEEVDWTEADGVELWGELHDGARSVLADAVWEVNGDKSTRPLSETATATTKSSEPESTTAANMESPTRLSLAE